MKNLLSRTLGALLRTPAPIETTPRRRSLSDRRRGSTGVLEVLAEFLPIAPTLRQVQAELWPALREMTQHPIYRLLEGLTAELNIVYSAGKVGSKTVAATLKRHPSVGPEVLHVHFLSPKGLALLQRLVERCADLPNAAAWRQQLVYGRWLRVLLAVNRALRAGGPGVRKPFLVTGVREPVALHLSYTFEVWWMYAEAPEGLTADLVRGQLAEGWHHQANAWLSDDLGAMFDLDVYARPFPAEQGWDIYENDAARVLLIRQESLKRLPEALGALYGFDPATVEVDTTNTAESKPYGAHYAAVRGALRLSEEELEAAYELPYVRHFYTAAEIEGFKARWRG
jgi:hypothetical protein